MGRRKGRCPLTPFRDCIGHTSMLLPRVDWGDARGCCPLTPFRDCVGHFFILLPRVYPQDTHTFPCFPTCCKKQSTSEKNPLATLTTSLQGGATTLKPTQRIGAMLLISSMLLTGVSVAEEPSNPPAATEALVTAAPTEAPTATPAQEQPTDNRRMCRPRRPLPKIRRTSRPRPLLPKIRRMRRPRHPLPKIRRKRRPRPPLPKIRRTSRPRPLTPKIRRTSRLRHPTPKSDGRADRDA